LHDEENSKPEEEEEKEDKKKTAIKQAIPKHTCSLCDYQTNKTTIKAHEWKCPHYKTYREYNLKHHVKSIQKIFAVIMIYVLIPQLVPY